MKSIILVILLCFGLKNEDFMKIDNMQTPKEFILLVYLPKDYSPEQATDVRGEWNKLLEKWKADGTYITSFVYPTKGYTINGPQKNEKEESLAAGNLRLISNLIVKATSIEDAKKLAQLCPVLQQGGTIEIREIQARPAQVVRP